MNLHKIAGKERREDARKDTGSTASICIDNETLCKITILFQDTQVFYPKKQIFAFFSCTIQKKVVILQPNCAFIAVMAKKIGVFDSGYGGLTILNEIRKALPEYDYIYVGDNARAPYGTRSFDIIYRYTRQAVEYLISQDCALIILACNTASAKALRTIQQRDLPPINTKRDENHKVNVLGVIRPTVEAVKEATKTKHVGVLATPATISSESYLLEFQKVLPDLVVTQQACPMWVPLIEAGEHNSEGADYFVEKYLREILEKDPQIDTLVLGCTHYPLLKEKIDKWLELNTPAHIKTIPQGNLFANSLTEYLTRHPEYREQLSTGGSCTYLTTENADRFSQSASLFLSTPVQAEHIDLE